MDHWNCPVPSYTKSENNLSPLNEMHINQYNHWNRVLFHWYQSYHWYQWSLFVSIGQRESNTPYSLVPDLLFESARVLEYAKIRTVLQSTVAKVCVVQCSHVVGDDNSVKDTLFLELVITRGYEMRATAIEGQNAFASTLCFAEVSRYGWSKHA